MRTIKIVLVVAAMGTAALMWSMSGVGGIYGTDDPVDGFEAGEKIEKEGNTSAVSEEGNFSASADNSGGADNIVGVVLSGATAITDFAGMVALLPWELQRLGFPAFFAFPVGFLAQAIAGIGVVQFAAGRVYR
jgi:hypothetical protein